MPDCPDCGRHANRIHRRGLQHIVYSDLYECARCRRRFGRLRAPLQAHVEFVFSRFTRCIRCGTYRVHRQRRRDRIDSMSRHPFSLLWRLTFAPLNKCEGCRLQYYDWRPVRPPGEAAEHG